MDYFSFLIEQRRPLYRGKALLCSAFTCIWDWASVQFSGNYIDRGSNQREHSLFSELYFCPWILDVWMCCCVVFCHVEHMTVLIAQWGNRPRQVSNGSSCKSLQEEHYFILIKWATQRHMCTHIHICISHGCVTYLHPAPSTQFTT